MEAAVRSSKTGLILVVTLSIIMLDTSCASMIRGEKQGIPVTSSPAGAAVIVNGQRQGVTPLKIRLARKDANQVIRIESAGYNPLEIRMKRRFSGVHAFFNVMGGCVAGSIIAIIFHIKHHEDPNFDTKKLRLFSSLTAVGSFFLLDLASSASYTLGPKDLFVMLTKADGTPRVETLLIDADDLQNIKWIRVRRD